MKVIIGQTKEGQQGSRPVSNHELIYLLHNQMVKDLATDEYPVRDGMTIDEVRNVLSTWSQSFCPDCGELWNHHHVGNTCLTEEEKTQPYFRVLIASPQKRTESLRVYNPEDLFSLKNTYSIPGQYWDTINDDEFEMITVDFKNGARMVIQKFDPKED